MVSVGLAGGRLVLLAGVGLGAGAQAADEGDSVHRVLLRAVVNVVGMRFRLACGGSNDRAVDCPGG